MSFFITWILLRIITSIYAGVISTIRPIRPIELSIPFFPPSTPIIQWLDRAFISPWMRWDAIWFEKIVSQGYSAVDGTAQFHPLYPWLATPLATIGVSPALSLVIIGAVAGIGLFYGFNRLALLDLPPRDAFFALLVFSLAPPAFILFAPYSEALFLLLAVLCFYFMREKKWWLAGFLGGLAVLTRQQGVFLIFPMAWELWESAGRNFKTLLNQWKDALALSPILLGMIVWMLYRAIILNDFVINFKNIQGFIYSLLISPSATMVVPAQQFVWPWQALFYAFEKIFKQPDVDIWVNIITGFLFLVILAISWRKMRASYRIYALIITAISFSYTTGPLHPYMGLPRHLFLAFPVFFGFTSTINKSWTRILAVAISAVGMTFLLGLYVLNAWIP